VSKLISNIFSSAEKTNPIKSYSQKTNRENWTSVLLQIL